jgi:hypothetical protein
VRPRITVTVLAPPVDLAVIDLLARVGLLARRFGSTVDVRDPPPGLADLASLVGMPWLLGGEVGGQAEGGEQVDVEEVVVADDPVT